MPLTTERKGDRVVLKNGDSLTGEVSGIEEAIVRFRADMVEGAVNVPFECLSRVEFGRRLPKENSGEDEISLVEGGRFRASVEEIDGQSLFFRTSEPEDSSAAVLAVEKVASVALDCGPLLLLHEEFAEERGISFVTRGGQWLVHDGEMLHIDQNQHNAKASARVRQCGRIRYAWTVDTARGTSAGVYILAADREGSEPSAYRIMLEYRRLAVYKTIEHGEMQGFLCELGTVGPKAAFKLDYNCETGRMQIWLDGQQIANLKDKSPIQSGEYVILRADGRAAFDDIRVERLRGQGELVDEEKGNDVVVLRNGDRIAGQVKEFSGGEVVVVEEGGERELRPDREKVWQIVFGGRSSSPVKGPSIVFWDDNRLAGKVSSLAGHVLALETQAIGELKFDVGRVKTIILEE